MIETEQAFLKRIRNRNGTVYLTRGEVDKPGLVIKNQATGKPYRVPWDEVERRVSILAGLLVDPTSVDVQLPHTHNNGAHFRIAASGLVTENPAVIVCYPRRGLALNSMHDGLRQIIVTCAPLNADMRARYEAKFPGVQIDHLVSTIEEGPTLINGKKTAPEGAV